MQDYVEDTEGSGVTNPEGIPKPPEPREVDPTLPPPNVGETTA